MGITAQLFGTGESASRIWLGNIISSAGRNSMSRTEGPEYWDSGNLGASRQGSRVRRGAWEVCGFAWLLGVSPGPDLSVASKAPFQLCSFQTYVALLPGPIHSPLYL